jgi:surfactin synthase thioesterase subunit
MGTDFAEHAASRVNGNIQLLLPRQQPYRLFGAYQGADVAAETALLIQPETHFLQKEPEAQLQITVRFPKGQGRKAVHDVSNRRRASWRRF